MRVPLAAGAVLVLGLAAWGGWGWWSAWRLTERTDNAFLAADIIAVASALEAPVAEVAVADNARVRRGDLLVRLDDAAFAAALRKAEAERAVASAARTGAEGRLRLQRARIEEARSMVAAREAESVLAASDHRRVTSLMPDNVASRRRFEETEAERRRAAAELARAAAAVTAAEEEMTVLAAEAEEAAAHLARAEADLAAAALDLERATVRAPADGWVGNVGVRAGEYVKAGRQLLALVPAGGLHVVANFKETQLPRMRPGQPVAIKVDALPDRTLRGRIESFAPASGALFSLLPPENATGNYSKVVQRVPVRIRLEEPDAAAVLRPGLSAVVSVDTGDAGEGAPLADKSPWAPGGAPLVSAQ
ncbi:MAG TPA: HlyD family secretion protein [Azospirillaceae bacterium]|nr:HlyD family secretion protein [Azospirillaceae bacterium]